MNSAVAKISFIFSASVLLLFVLLIVVRQVALPKETRSQAQVVEAGLRLRLYLHGIGVGGDNANKTSLGNTSPQTMTRPITVDLYDNNNSLTKSVNSTAVYDPQLGIFQAPVALGNITSGSYTIRVSTAKYLKRQLNGIINVTQAQISVPPFAMIVGDTNSDNLINILDFNQIMDCFSELTPPRNCSDSQKKFMADLTDDGKVNQNDYNLFLRELSVQGGDIDPVPGGNPTSIPSHIPVTPTQGPIFNPTLPPSLGLGIWISKEEIMKQPVSGAAWDAMYNVAKGSWGTADISNQDSDHDVYTMAGAIVCVRTGEFCDKAKSAVVSAINTEDGGRWLAVGRNLTAYVISADLLNLRPDGNSTSNGTKVGNWIKAFLTKKLAHNNSGEMIVFPVFDSGSNAEAQQGAGYIAVAAYLKDTNALQYGWNRFRLYSCDRTNNPETVINVENGFNGGWSHASSMSGACAVNPKGTVKDGRRIDGAIINDMVRGGSFKFPPGYTSYPWVGIEGYVPAALLLYRAGYPAFEIGDKAVLRTFEYLHQLRQESGNADWFDGSRANETIFIINKMYGKTFPLSGATGPGRTVGYTDWTHK